MAPDDAASLQQLSRLSAKLLYIQARDALLAVGDTLIQVGRSARAAFNRIQISQWCLVILPPPPPLLHFSTHCHILHLSIHWLERTRAYAGS